LKSVNGFPRIIPHPDPPLAAKIQELGGKINLNFTVSREAIYQVLLYSAGSYRKYYSIIGSADSQTAIPRCSIYCH
jgi:hypothetical protein